MADKKPGGSAFPHAYTDQSHGMTLRDYFAAKALAWCLWKFGGNADDQKQFAEAAYQIADAMIAERAR